MKITKIFFLLLLLTEFAYSQLSINISSKNIISIDSGFSLLFNFHDHPFFVITEDTSTRVAKGISFANSLGLSSNELSFGYAWGVDYGHSGFDYNWLYLLYGYNWWEVLNSKNGYYWGLGARKTAYVLVLKIEYQRLIMGNSNLFVFEIGVGL